MTVVARCDGSVAPFEPSFKLVSHHMTICACGRIIGKIGVPLGIDKRKSINADGQTDGRSQQDTYCGLSVLSKTLKGISNVHRESPRSGELNPARSAYNWLCGFGEYYLLCCEHASPSHMAKCFNPKKIPTLESGLYLTTESGNWLERDLGNIVLHIFG